MRVLMPRRLARMRRMVLVVLVLVVRGRLVVLGGMRRVCWISSVGINPVRATGKLAR